MLNGLSGHVAIVTGAGSGIGRATAIRLASEGMQIVVNDIEDSDALEETRRLIQSIPAGAPDPHLVLTDVSDETAVAELFRQTLERFGKLDMLVNNAGILKESNLDQPGEDLRVFDRTLAVNLRGYYLCATQAIRHFLEQDKPGRIVNISSVHEVIPDIESLPYAISKSGIGNLTRSLALKYACRNIRVNGVGPGAIDTAMNTRWMSKPEAKAEVLKYIPMGRIGQSEEIAAMVAFLLSDEAAYITGQTFFVDGGMMLYPSFLYM